MKIKKLEIIGFKSFVDRTVLHFDHEVTGIVGPNGCGKSNVVDAIKWAMGEQSAQRLRGRQMDDIIFSGSETRGPHGFAEVSITFDNTDGLAPADFADYAEIVVTRRLDRQGNSDYSINKTPVRLLDVTNLLLGTGVGRRGYSIIEQGRIGYIVSSKPADRRLMVEEAAGVTKFKARKRAAERKMEQTRTNLVRIHDITSELQKNLDSLQRQAQKAERYKRYRSEVRDHELYVASHRYLELTATHKVVSAELEEASAHLEGVRSGLRVREAEVEAERVVLQHLESRVEGAQNRAYEIDNSVRHLEGQVSQKLERLGGLLSQERLAEREIGELTSQREKLVDEREALRIALAGHEAAEREEAAALERENVEHERRRSAADDAERAVAVARGRGTDADRRITRAEAVLHGIERRREDERARADKLRTEQEGQLRLAEELAEQAAELDARLGGLRCGRAETVERRAELEVELEALRLRIKESDARVEALRETLAERRSRLRSLEELHHHFEGVGAGVQALMTKFVDDPLQADRAGVRGLVADRLDCPPALTRALAAALGDRLQHVVVDDIDAAVAAMQFLRDEERGRATLVPFRPRRVVGDRPDMPEGDGILGGLAERVRPPGEDTGLVLHLLGDVLLTESLDVALRVHAAGFAGTLVTLEGEVLRADGALTGGSADDVGAHMLELQREMRELNHVVVGLEEDLAAAVAVHVELRRGIGERQAAIETTRAEAHDTEIAIVTAEQGIRRVQTQREHATDRADALRRDVEALLRGLDQADVEEREARNELEAAHASRLEATRELEAADEIHRQRRDAVDEQAARVTEVHVRAAQARERVEGDRSTLSRMTRSIDELDVRVARLEGDVADGARQQGAIVGGVVASRERLSALVREAMEAHEALGRARARYEEARNQVAESEVVLKRLRGTIDQRSQRQSELALRARELEMDTRHLLDHVEERHRIDVRRVLTDYHARELPDDVVHSRIDELLRLISRMGEINLLAIEEYEEKSHRYQYLMGQKVDLEEALVQLDRAIRKMNRESRRLFREAFDAVNERFKRVFPQLFRGGKAELRLTDPEDLLESGVDIVAQPPGKRLGSLELMSGGEKALTAVALIFSLFQYRPSPFCLLDEVDAPLDEANVGRFAEAIRQMTDRSQFIVITHSKRTMEFADVLYGVTMGQPGVSSLVAVELTGDRRPAPHAASAA